MTGVDLEVLLTLKNHLRSTVLKGKGTAPSQYWQDRLLVSK